MTKQERGFLGRYAEVYNAEVIGICGGLEAAVTSPMIGIITSIHIYTDNLNVAQKAGTIPNDSSQEEFRKFKQIAENWLDIGRKVSVQWIPAHIGIKMNDIADGEAKKYAGNPSTINATKEVQIISYACQTARKTQHHE